ncbi:MAG: hypothetical protein ACYTGH_04500 [Planctomycetota bacterium]|jgi:hypothetical protein
MSKNVRQRFDDATAGRPVDEPVYAVYDWFVEHRPHVDWARLFDLGLGRINHANVIRHEHPNFERIEETREENGTTRRDVRLVTDHGELHEWYLGEWRQDHFIKTPEDYRIMARALEGVRVHTDNSAFEQSEQAVGDGGITVGQAMGLGSGRTPLMVLQIDWVGLEQWSLDLACELPEMMDLLEIMNAIKLEEIRAAAASSAEHIKLWENLSIETMGPNVYRQHLVPLYREIIGILASKGKRLQVHYDGQLKSIADQIASLGFDGIDSFTEAPEGDMSVEEARALWPDKFLWVHPNLGLYRQADTLAAQVRRLREAAGNTRSCLLISEDIPPDWQTTVPMVLEALGS